MTPTIAARARSVHADSPQGKPALRVLPILGPSADEPSYRLLEGDALSAGTSSGLRRSAASLSGQSIATWNCWKALAFPIFMTLSRSATRSGGISSCRRST